MFGRAVFDQNEKTVFELKILMFLIIFSESINISLKDYVEFQVLKAVTATDAMYFGTNLLTFPKNLQRPTEIRRQQTSLTRR